MDAALTVNSLALLGFNTDDYTHSYKGLAFNIEPLNARSFDKENEVTTELTLLCILHFLLTRLDFPHFPQSVQHCWPYYDSKAKNTFKRAVNASLERIYEDVKDDLPSSLWLLHMYAKPSDVWTLLRSLSDLCLESAIASLTSSQELSSSGRKDTITAVNDYSITNGSIEDDEKKCRDELIDSITYSQSCIDSIIATKLAMRSRQQQYMQELSVRLNKAKLILSKHPPAAQTNEREVADGRAVRSEKIAKMRRYVQLLRELSTSSVLQEGVAHVMTDHTAAEADDSTGQHATGAAMTYFLLVTQFDYSSSQLDRW